ncbi:hypothetical protein [uncultured Campylobacter sp.]|uniref:hypothetical protein n=1 Tax=uncultured Campylobacter sp. TaxID=218934 RepID=UPI00260A2636|nr:hypothetical protein [uncultured Campylobacter sp.]
MVKFRGTGHCEEFCAFFEDCFYASVSRIFSQIGGRVFYAPSALYARRERGTPPQSLLGKSTSRAGKQIPICAYPKVAIYVDGDENSASSFERG